jgi:hypothetical protein
MTNLLVPINWSILRDRVGTCLECGNQREFKYWVQIQPLFFQALQCPSCYAELNIGGAVKDYFKEKREES